MSAKFSEQKQLKTQLLLAHRALSDMRSMLEGQAFMYEANNKLERAIALQEAAAILEDYIARITNDKLCDDNCKNMYFCERKKGHKGRHSETGLTWDQHEKSSRQKD
jgi:hypothetical protein